MSGLAAVDARLCVDPGRLRQPTRQGPGAGAGPWRARPAAGSAQADAAVPAAAVMPSQAVQPAAAPPYFATCTEHQDSRSVVRVRGELDIGSQARLRQAIDAALSRHNPRLLVLDLAELSFIDCTGLRIIMWARQCQARQGHELVIENAQPAVRRVLRLTSCDTVLHLSPP